MADNFSFLVAREWMREEGRPSPYRDNATLDELERLLSQ